MPNRCLTTRSLTLEPCSPEQLRSLAEGPAAFAASFGRTVADGCLDFQDGFRLCLARLTSGEPDAEWWAPYLFVHSLDNTVMGLGGFKGPPNAQKSVEFGYAVAPTYQNRGFATEAAAALIADAFETDGIETVCAHTLSEVNASTRVLSKCGMRQVAEIIDPEDGKIWRWEKTKAEHVGPA